MNSPIIDIIGQAPQITVVSISDIFLLFANKIIWSQILYWFQSDILNQTSASNIQFQGTQLNSFGSHVLFNLTTFSKVIHKIVCSFEHVLVARNLKIISISETVWGSHEHLHFHIIWLLSSWSKTFPNFLWKSMKCSKHNDRNWWP